MNEDDQMLHPIRIIWNCSHDNGCQEDRGVELIKPENIYKNKFQIIWITILENIIKSCIQNIVDQPIGHP